MSDKTRTDDDAPKMLELPDSPGLWWMWETHATGGDWRDTHVHLSPKRNANGKRDKLAYEKGNDLAKPRPGHWIKVAPPPPPSTSTPTT